MNDFPDNTFLELNPYLGRYRIKREIGRGFSSLVYEAVDTVRERTVALKVLTLGQSLSDERRRDMAERFVREARAISALSHPGIVSIYEIGQAGDGRQFIAMELLKGESLRARLEREGTLAPEDAVPIALQVADALHYAHERGIVHRDVKPDNIFLLDNGASKLMDFGVAHIISEGALTQTGTVVGSPAYMSPEQISGQLLDGGSDVFSLGVTLAEMLTGTKPFDAPTIPAVMNRILNRPPQMEHIQPKPLRKAVERALAKNPVARYASAAAFADALRRHVVPGLPVMLSEATTVMAALPRPMHRRGNTDSRLGWSAMFAEQSPKRTVLWSVIVAAVTVFAALLLLAARQPAPILARTPELQNSHSAHITVIPTQWRRAGRSAPTYYAHSRDISILPSQSTAATVKHPVITAIAHNVPPKPVSIVQPLLVVTPPSTDSTLLKTATVPGHKASLVRGPIIRVADTRQEQHQLPQAIDAPEMLKVVPVEVRSAPAHLVHQTRALFPASLRGSGITGTVTLQLLINSAGHVREATVVRSSGVDDLDAAALDAVGAWQYEPALQDGQPVPATVTAQVDFPAAQ